MTAIFQSRAADVPFYREPLESGENERLCDIVSRGRKALGALFLSQLQVIAAIEAQADRELEPLQQRQLSFAGFRRAVLAYRPKAGETSQKEFANAVAESVLLSLRSGNEPFSCDEFTLEQFQRRYLGAPAPKAFSRKTLRTLLRWTREGDAAIEKLMLHNTGLVLVIAWRQCRDSSRRDDYLMEGMIGLRRAILRYDRRFECKLSTFAPHWIKHCLYRYEQNHERLVRLPVHALEKRQAVRVAERAILEKKRKEGDGGERASVAEIAKRTKLKPELVLTLLHAENRTISTDHPVREEIGNTFGDLLTDDRPLQEDRLHLSDMVAKVEAAMQTELTGRERHVIKERYFGDGRTLQEIGVDLGVCRERIRQIEAEALGKLLSYFEQLDTL